jgi:hypothetical protein
MSVPALALMALLNLVASVGFLNQGNYGMAVVFASYAVACGGFI